MGVVLLWCFAVVVMCLIIFFYYLFVCPPPKKKEKDFAPHIKKFSVFLYAGFVLHEYERMMVANQKDVQGCAHWHYSYPLVKIIMKWGGN